MLELLRCKLLDVQRTKIKDKGKWDIRKERKQEQIMMQRLSRSQIWIETQDIKTKALSDNLRKVREKKGISENRKCSRSRRIQSSMDISLFHSISFYLLFISSLSIFLLSFFNNHQSSYYRSIKRNFSREATLSQ